MSTISHSASLSLNGKPIPVVSLCMEYGLNRLPTARVEAVAEDVGGAIDAGTPCTVSIRDTSWDLIVSKEPTTPASHPSLAAVSLVDPVLGVHLPPMAAMKDREPTIEQLLSRLGIRTSWGAAPSFPALGAFALESVDLLSEVSKLCRKWFWRDQEKIRFASDAYGTASIDSSEVFLCGTTVVVRSAFAEPPAPGTSAQVPGYSGMVRSVRVTAGDGRCQIDAVIGPPPLLGRWREPSTFGEMVTVSSAEQEFRVRVTCGDRSEEIPAEWMGRRLLGGRHAQNWPVQGGDQVLALVPARGVTARPVIVLPYSPAEPGSEYVLRAKDMQLAVEDAVEVEVGDAVYIR